MKSDVYTNTVSMRLFMGLISVAAQFGEKRPVMLVLHRDLQYFCRLDNDNG